MNNQNPYDVLGVSPSASAVEVKKRYRELAKDLHPDLNPGDPKSEEQFKRVSAAFGVLSDEKKRKLYDEFGDLAIKLGFDAEKLEQLRFSQNHAGGQAYKGFSAEDLFGGGGFDLADLFEGFAQARGGHAPQNWDRPKKAKNVQTSLSISFKDAALGVEREINLQIPNAVEYTDSSGSQSTQTQMSTKKLKVKIPAGVEHGQAIRLAGQGMSSPSGGESGDLLIKLHVQPDPIFKRNGDDLSLTLPITISEAMLGAEVQVPTLKGRVKLTVPAGTQSGTRLRLKAQGIARAGKKAGDLFAEVEVLVPKPPHDDDAIKKVQAIESLYEGSIRVWET